MKVKRKIAVNFHDIEGHPDERVKANVVDRIGPMKYHMWSKEPEKEMTFVMIVDVRDAMKDPQFVGSVIGLVLSVGVVLGAVGGIAWLAFKGITTIIGWF